LYPYGKGKYSRLIHVTRTIYIQIFYPSFIYLAGIKLKYETAPFNWFPADDSFISLHCNRGCTVS